MNTHDIDIELPPLPEPDADHYDSGVFAPAWKQGKMQAYAHTAIEEDRHVTKELLQNPIHVHTNMCRGIIAPITFDQLAHILGEEATNAWLNSRQRTVDSVIVEALENAQSLYPCILYAEALDAAKKLTTKKS